MNEYTRKHMGHECPPSTDNPAQQPHPPGDGKACGDLPKTTPPILHDPTPCPPPDPCCKCPQKPGSTPNCLEDLIAQQTAGIVAADQANRFKADLEKLLENAKKSHQAYTRDTYENLVEEWLRQDAAIAELLRKLECTVWCWRCILDCYVCPLLNDLHYAEKWLYDDGKLYAEAHNLYDLQYWHSRDKAAKKRRFDRIDNVMKAWGSPTDANDWVSPAETIGKALNTNRGLIEDAGKVLGTEPGKAIYDVFLRLVPLHLAIAPPAGSDWVTKIDKRYTEFCECNQGAPDACCGPDVGELSLRQRLIGPQPYLIDPNNYYTLICCLVENRYAPAKEALNKAEAELAAVGRRIAGYEDQLKGGKDGWVKKFSDDAKTAIPRVIDCCDYERDEDRPQRPSRSY